MFRMVCVCNTSQPVPYSGWAKTSIAFSILVMAIARCSADKKVYHIPQVFTDVQVTSQMFQNDLIFLLWVIDCVVDSNEYNYLENRLDRLETWWSETVGLP